MSQPWILSIDFGISYTSVAAKVGDREVDPTSGTDRFYENRRVRSVAWWFDDGTRIVQLEGTRT